MNGLVAGVFIAVYAGMLLGRIPSLQLDRTGVALLGAIVLVAVEANVGSAATLVGNPQNMLIGEALGLEFGRYALLALPPVIGGLALTWGVIALLTRGHWRLGEAGPPAPAPALDGWQTGKGLLVAAALLVLFAGLFMTTPVLSNLVSNVPAVMLLLPAAQGENAGLILGLASGLAGNLLIIGSIANIIVVGLASADDVTISWRRHAALGVPVTLATLALAGGWLWLLSLPAP